MKPSLAETYSGSKKSFLGKIYYEQNKLQTYKRAS